MNTKELPGNKKSLIYIFSEVPKKRDTIRRNTSITTESPARVYR